MPKDQHMLVPLQIFSKLGRNPEKRETLLRNLVTACIMRDRIMTTALRAKEASKLCNIAIDLAKDPTSVNREILDSVIFQHKVTLPKLFDYVLPRYINRSQGYTRVIPCSMQTEDKFPRAILEFVDAPGDTMVEVAKREIPAIDKLIPSISEQINSLESQVSACQARFDELRTVLRADELPKLPECIELSRLQRRRLMLLARRKTLEDILELPFLPPNHVENKFPAIGHGILVDRFIVKIPNEEQEEENLYSEFISRNQPPPIINNADNSIKPEGPSPFAEFRNPNYVAPLKKIPLDKKNIRPFVQKVIEVRRVGPVPQPETGRPTDTKRARRYIQNRHLAA